MNTTKKLLVLCLAALLGIISFIPSTFSWYTHNDKQSGDAIRYQRSNLYVSNGSVSLNTVQYEQEENGEVKYNADKKKVIKSDSPAFSVPADAPGHTYYYRTTLENNGSTTVYAGFYLNNITNSSQVFVGNNYPTLAEKATGYPTRIRAPYSKTRIYFDANDASGWTNSGNSNFFLVYKTASDSSYSVTSQLSSSVSVSSHRYYYVDLPVENVSEFFIAKASSDTAAITTEGFNRTKTFTKATPSTLYQLTGKTTNDDYNYAACTAEIKSGALGVSEYYKEITTTSGQQFFCDLPGEYTAASVSYERQNSGDANLTVDSRTGSCTISGAITGGVKTHLIGTWGDTMDIFTQINMPNTVDNIPVCQNIKIEPGNSVDIEWYITNKTGSATSTYSIYATI